jgi:hypothetical protein
VLWAWADHRTGRDAVNAPTLLYRLGHDPEFGKSEPGALRASERTLQALHDKGYVWYHGQRGTTTPQPCWLHGYPLGTSKACRFIDLSKLTDKRQVTQDDIARSVGSLTVHCRFADDKNNNSRIQELKNTSYPIGDDANDARNDARNDAEMTQHKAGAQISSTAATGQVTTHVTHKEACDARDAHPKSDKRRIKIVRGDDPYPVDADTGLLIPWEDARHLLNSGEAVQVNQ